MSLRPVALAIERCDEFRQNSDRDYFDGLMFAGELIAKLATVGFVACMEEDSQRTRYSVLHSLVRADGIGRWAEILTDVVQGSASSTLIKAAYPFQSELVTRYAPGTTQYDCVARLRAGLGVVSSVSPIENRVQLLSLFRDFSALRNATRGHGAYDSVTLRKVAEHIDPAIRGLADLMIFKAQWVHLFQNLSGKYRITRLGQSDELFSELAKKPPQQRLINGLYLWADAPRYVELTKYDIEDRTMYLPNGGFNGKRYETICYTTGDKQAEEATPYLAPPGQLPESETSALRDLRVVGECLTNAPKPARDYVERRKLETELFDLVCDDRHPVITLQGRGGIGKTSVTLQVIEKLSANKRFGQTCWLSARDIDLLAEGVKRVKPDSTTIDGFAELYCSMFTGCAKRGKEARATLESAMGRRDSEPSLFIFDNFETVSFPTEVYSWIDTFIRLPNKVLVTTRIREFRGDWPVDVEGMEYEEARALVKRVAQSLFIAVPKDTEFDLLYEESEGHPYVIRVMMGDYAKEKKVRRIRTVVATNDELLNALFERTFAQLSAGATRLFLTCAAWNSIVPMVVLDAVLATADEDVQFGFEKAVTELKLSSLIEQREAQADSHLFIDVPLITQQFGKQKLMLSPYRRLIESDMRILHLFGAADSTEQSGLIGRIDRFVKSVARLDDRVLILRCRRVLEMLASGIPELWLTIAQLEVEQPTSNEARASDLRAQKAIGRFLEHAKAEHDLMGRVGRAWLEYFRLSELLDDQEGMLNASVGAARLGSVGLSELSRITTNFNRLVSSQKLKLDATTRDSIAKELVAAFESAIRREKPNAIDYSRLGWLYLRLNREVEALEQAKKGLSIDPNEEYCIRLHDRLTGG